MVYFSWENHDQPFSGGKKILLTNKIGIKAVRIRFFSWFFFYLLDLGVDQQELKSLPTIYHGSLNVPIEHHPAIRYMVYNGYYKVMSNIPKMGQLPTPVYSQLIGMKTAKTWFTRKNHGGFRPPGVKLNSLGTNLTHQIAWGNHKRPGEWMLILPNMGIICNNRFWPIPISWNGVTQFYLRWNLLPRTWLVVPDLRPGGRYVKLAGLG